eukprot:gene10496-14107_t
MVEVDLDILELLIKNISRKQKLLPEELQTLRNFKQNYSADEWQECLQIARNEKAKRKLNNKSISVSDQNEKSHNVLSTEIVENKVPLNISTKNNDDNTTSYQETSIRNSNNGSTNYEIDNQSNSLQEKLRFPNQTNHNNMNNSNQYDQNAYQNALFDSIKLNQLKRNNQNNSNINHNNDYNLSRQSHFHDNKIIVSNATVSSNNSLKLRKTVMSDDPVSLKMPSMVRSNSTGRQRINTTHNNNNNNNNNLSLHIRTNNNLYNDKADYNSNIITQNNGNDFDSRKNIHNNNNNDPIQNFQNSQKIISIVELSDENEENLIQSIDKSRFEYNLLLTNRYKETHLNNNSDTEDNSNSNMLEQNGKYHSSSSNEIPSVNNNRQKLSVYQSILKSLASPSLPSHTDDNFTIEDYDDNNNYNNINNNTNGSNNNGITNSKNVNKNQYVMNDKYQSKNKVRNTFANNHKLPLNNTAESSFADLHSNYSIYKIGTPPKQLPSNRLNSDKKIVHPIDFDGNNEEDEEFHNNYYSDRKHSNAQVYDEIKYDNSYNNYNNYDYNNINQTMNATNSYHNPIQSSLDQMRPFTLYDQRKINGGNYYSNLINNQNNEGILRSDTLKLSLLTQQNNRYYDNGYVWQGIFHDKGQGKVARICIVQDALFKVFEEHPIRVDGESGFVDVVWRDNKRGNSNNNNNNNTEWKVNKPVGFNSSANKFGNYIPRNSLLATQLTGTTLGSDTLRRERFSFDDIFIGPNAMKRNRIFIHQRVRKSIETGTNLVFLCLSCGNNDKIISSNNHQNHNVGQVESTVSLLLGNEGGSGIISNVIEEIIACSSNHLSSKIVSNNHNNRQNRNNKSLLLLPEKKQINNITLCALVMSGPNNQTIIDLFANKNVTPRLKRIKSNGKIILSDINRVQITSVADFDRLAGILVGKRKAIEEIMSLLLSKKEIKTTNNITKYNKNNFWEQTNIHHTFNDNNTNNITENNFEFFANDDIFDVQNTASMLIIVSIEQHGILSSSAKTKAVDFYFVCPCGESYMRPGFDIRLLSEIISCLPNTSPPSVALASPLTAILT